MNPGLVATRATKAARALVLPVVDVAAEDAPAADDVDGAAADEVPGLAGRGGAFAAGGGEAAGAGRAGGTVGIADLGVSLGGVAPAAGVVGALGVAEVAGDVAGRLASVGVADAGRVASAARAVGMPAAPEPAGRVGAGPGDADPVAATPDAELVGVTPDATPAGTALLLGADAVARGVVPGCAGCEDVGLVAAGLLEASAVGSVAGAVVDLRPLAAAADDADVGADADAVPEAVLPVATGAADSVGGIGASPDPRSAASNIGDAHVPEYALSVDDDADALAERAAESADVEVEAFVAAGAAGMPNPAGDLSASVVAGDLGAAAPCPRAAVS